MTTHHARAGRKGGNNGSRADKVRAALASALVRAKKARRLRFNGRTDTVKGWAAYLGIPQRTIWRRLAKDMTDRQALERRRA